MIERDFSIHTVNFAGLISASDANVEEPAQVESQQPASRISPLDIPSPPLSPFDMGAVRGSSYGDIGEWNIAMLKRLQTN
jgi:hypothetical protein